MVKKYPQGLFRGPVWRQIHRCVAGMIGQKIALSRLPPLCMKNQMLNDWFS
jgi:hypothetical protein